MSERKCEYCGEDLGVCDRRTCLKCGFENFSKKQPQRGAYRKGREAFKTGLPKSANPYPDLRGEYRNMVTFSQSYINAWNAGWEFEKRQQKSDIVKLEGMR